MPERLVVIGGDAAGLSAATNARRRREADALEIVVFERGDWVSFSACGEPYYVAGLVPEITDLLALSVEEAAHRGIQIHRRREVTSIDLAARRVTVHEVRDDGSHGAEERVDYDYLMYATGASTRKIPIEGIELDGVYEMHTLDDAIATRAALDHSVERAVVVGGGFVGLEMAEAFRHHGLHTTLISADDTLLSGSLDASMAQRLIDELRARDLHVELGHRVSCFSGADGRVRSVGCGEREYPADIVLVAAGTVPNVELARAAGLRIGETGAVWVDARQRTSDERVWSGGDCAESRHRLSGRPVNIHLGTYANRQGRIAGFNIGGGDETFEGVLGTAITKFMDLEVSRTGLTEREARALGRNVVAEEFEATTTGGYWPEARPMRLRAIAECGTRRLLGAQIVGGPTAGKRIDALAMAIWNEMTVDEMVNVDLSYAPPFSGVWDPVAVAARKLQEALG
ncbi:MAG: flavoprotein oxidoreductase [Chloroflexi bacterium]|nr:flavoprotein oxidoreductase [Chloroflexota bacterium]